MFSCFADRSRIRVYDSPENAEKCRSCGFTDIITGKGPFSEYENIRDFEGCDILVTKDSGKAGGFAEKMSAARKLGMQIIVIERPQEEGYYVNKAWGIIMLLR
ncbi:precorrin-6A/cobalt-precorrin-6A reductase [Ruminococcus sp. HUN007]|uniref:precorrin-6A/cobalt-precorrin-6A reductase n=1 Tax=Ruminococcus sp. HUN007 TaxID=1514668 RepID=UPI000678DA9E|nr:precorrin-6A/cobalt-precorrin-6A reductase [Ruminococcus sp. HUN007]